MTSLATATALAHPPRTLYGATDTVLDVQPSAVLSETLPSLSVVVPARDERGNVRPLVDEIRAALDGVLDYEIIFVDDASTDGTFDALIAARRDGASMLRILRHERACGQSFALLSGVRVARAPWIATLDADGQNPPDDILALIEVARQQPCDAHWCIAGHRVTRRDTRWKKFQSRLANRVRAALLGDATPDTGCGLKLMPRETWLAVPGFDHVHRFLPALVRRIGGEVIVHPVSHRPRTREASKYGMWDRLLPGLVDLVGVLWLGRRLARVDAVESVEQ